jgi:hypothetical protein
MQVEIALVTVGAYTKYKLSLETCILMLKDQDNLYHLPYTNLTDHSTTFALASYLLEKYAGVKALMNGVGYIALTQQHIFERLENERSIIIPYLAFIPECITLPSKAEWIQLDNLVNKPLYKDHYKLIQHSLNH